MECKQKQNLKSPIYKYDREFVELCTPLGTGIVAFPPTHIYMNMSGMLVHNNSVCLQTYLTEQKSKA